MKSSLILFCAIFTSIVGAAAKQIDCALDFASFQRDDGKILWELYYSLPDTLPKYIKQPNGSFLGSIYFRVELKAATLKQPIVKEWIIDNASDSETTSHIRNLAGVKQFTLSAGEYAARILIADANDTMTVAERSFSIALREITHDRLVLSDMQIASEIIPAAQVKNAQNSPQFIKNTYYITPNPLKEFVGTLPEIAVYAELYNAKRFLKDSLTVEYRLYDAAHRMVQRNVFRRFIVSEYFTETAKIPLKNQPSGLYYISMTLGAIGEPDTVSAISKIYVLNPDLPPKLNRVYSEDELFQSSEFATMTDDLTEEEFRKAKYIATKREIELYNSLTETLAKQKFLFRFWRERDPNPDTYINEKLDEYHDLIRFADANFSNMTYKQGWKTDKGRILLKYGKPTQIDRYYNIADTRPYEIWFYSHLQGGIQFSFVDKTGNSMFVLVHSTAMGEVRNDDWINMYVKTAGSGNGVELPSTPR